MISVENFYWVLYENVLKSSGLDVAYYYPFGTMSNIIKKQYHAQTERYKHHVFFYFDQEPMWQDNLGPYELEGGAWDQKALRILANSEHSLIKKQCCRQRGMLDWYFFYHGFAALDWYRDVQYVDSDLDTSKVFCSFNHLVRHKRAYRMSLTARLLDRDLLQSGDISFHGSRDDCIAELKDTSSPLSSADRKLIEMHLCRDSHRPLIVDQCSLDGDFSAHFGYQEYALWQRSLFHLVNETVFYDHKLHLTEKIFKPIVALRPFILVAAPGNLEYLKGYGFKTFSNWIDESYDSILDTDLRLEHVANQIQKLCAMSASQLRQMHIEMRSVLEYNKKHFFGEFRRIIVDELLENFVTCINIWNNGRIDGRERPHPKNLSTVKQILLR